MKKKNIYSINYSKTEKILTVIYIFIFSVIYIFFLHDTLPNTNYKNLLILYYILGYILHYIFIVTYRVLINKLNI